MVLDNLQSTEKSVFYYSMVLNNNEETDDNLVWIPVNGGTKYHSKSSCSKMKYPIQVTK
jgi:hypothetical protein